MKKIGEIIHEEGKKHTSETQALIDEIRNEFGDTATKGIGSFAFYGVFVKKLGVPFVRRAFHESISSGTNARSPKGLFIWMLKDRLAVVNWMNKDKKSYPPKK